MEVRVQMVRRYHESVLVYGKVLTAEATQEYDEDASSEKKMQHDIAHGGSINDAKSRDSNGGVLHSRSTACLECVLCRDVCL